MGKKFNKGEWSEFYAFIYILAQGKIYAADEDRNKVDEKFYNILSAIKKDIEYSRNPDKKVIEFEYAGEKFGVPLNEFQENLDDLFEAIKEGKRTFEIPMIEPLINNLKIESIKEGSGSKGDIQLRIFDEMVGYHPVHSFSVKSYVGGKATLLNTSNLTIFKYKLKTPLSDVEIGQINQLKGPGGWLNNVIAEIYNFGSGLEFKSLSGSMFHSNLQMIDYRLPELLAKVLVEGYFVKNKDIPLAVDSFLNKNSDEKGRMVKYKINELLVASALGMVPSNEWSGVDEANGGYIVVKENSEVLCYHLYERNELKEYLYNNTRFDTPSTSRYGLGVIEKKEDGSQEISLGLQIRFK